MERAVLTTNSAFPSGDFGTWAACERALPHVLVGANWIEQEQMTFPAAENLLFRTGCYLRERGKYVESEPLSQRALTIIEQQLGPFNLEATAVLATLAELYKAQGK